MARTNLSGAGPVATVADAVMHASKVLPVGTRVGEFRCLFADDHVHVASSLNVGSLGTVINRADVHGAQAEHDATRYGRLGARVTSPDAELATIHRRMRSEHERRLAVVDGDGMLQGLLCLRKTGLGFCSDQDVLNRRIERDTPSRDLDHDHEAMTRRGYGGSDCGGGRQT